MRKVFAIFLLFAFAFTACKKSENELPEFEKVEVTNDNSTITVTFSEGVYAKNNKTGNLTNDNFKLTCSKESTTYTFSVAHTAGEKTAVFTIDYTSSITGDETFTIQPYDGESIFDADGGAMEATKSINTDPLAKLDYGITGEWYSSGSNVAPLLAYFLIDSIYAKFEANNTYLVESYASGAKTTYTGTFTQEKSGIGNIWNIVLNQSAPTAITSEGIFEITAANGGYTMKYEVVQTEPSLGTAPTAEAGFGSSSGGTLGTMNIQTFVKIAQ